MKGRVKTGADLAAARAKLGLTQEQLAKVLRMSPGPTGGRGSISRWENDLNARGVPSIVGIVIENMLDGKYPRGTATKLKKDVE